MKLRRKIPAVRVKIRAGKNVRFLKKVLGFLGFNVCTVARGTLDTGIRLRSTQIHED